MIQLPLKYIQDSLLKFKANSYKLIDSYIPTHIYGLGILLMKYDDEPFLLMLDMLSIYSFAQYKEFSRKQQIEGFNIDVEIGVSIWDSGWDYRVNKQIALKEFYIPLLGDIPYSLDYRDYVRTLYHLNIIYESIVELKIRNKRLDKQLDINKELSNVSEYIKQELLEHLSKHPLISND